MEDIDGVNIGNFNPSNNEMGFVKIDKVSQALFMYVMPHTPTTSSHPTSHLLYSKTLQRFLKEGMRVRGLECRDYCNSKVWRHFAWVAKPVPCPFSPHSVMPPPPPSLPIP